MWSAIIVKSVSHFPNHSFGIFPTHRDHAETPTSDPASQVSSQVSSIKLHSTSAQHTGILVKGMFFQFVAWSAPLLSLLVSVVCIYVKSWSSPLSPHHRKLCYESTFPLLIFCQKIRKRVKNNRFGTTFQRNRVPNHVFHDNFSDFHSGIIAGRPNVVSQLQFNQFPLSKSFFRKISYPPQLR